MALKKTESRSSKLLAMIGALGVGAVLTTSAFAQQRERLPRECRAEIRDLCAFDGRPDRAAIRACLQEKFSELSNDCASQIRDRAGQNRQQSANSTPYVAPAQVSRTVIYGAHQRQVVDIYEPEGAVDALPLVLFVHGGGWSMGDHKRVQAKPAHFNSNDYYFASTGYRLLPDHPVEEQAADIGAAIEALRGQASAIGFDPDRIVLIGHSAGAHLAALVATDPRYAGDNFSSIKGVILLDGAGYDVAANIASAGPQAWQLYTNVFGRELERQQALSPITHVGGEDAPNWLALYVEEREVARYQAFNLAMALNEAGSKASAYPISGTDHGRMNREIGIEPGAAQTEAIDAFLEAVLS